MDEKLIQCLNQVSAEQLADIIKTIYGMDDNVDHKIEAALFPAGSGYIVEQLEARIASIEQDDDFISYRDVSTYSMQLDYLVDDIASLVDTNPEKAFHLINRFINTHEDTFNRSDDSGEMGDSYSRAVDIWLLAAQAWQSNGSCSLVWAEELKQRHYSDDYGVWYGRIADSKALLGDVVLRTLAKEFEDDYCQLSKQESKSNQYRASCARYGIEQVARALGDIELYEHAFLIEPSALNDAQKEKIVRFCLQQQDGQAALKWLTGSWDDGLRSYTRKELLEEAYQLTGQTEELIRIRSEAYRQDPCYRNLQALLEVLPEQDRTPVLQGAAEQALKIKYFSSRIDTLIDLGEIEQAVEQLLQYGFQEGVIAYGNLLRWTEVFANAEYYLAEVACYRLLLLDILNEGRSKAYGYAADYYQNLARLDTRVDDYQPLASWQEFQAELKNRHGRKYSFWNRL
ncbi:DUF6880 family protein [Oceanospirillum beijerinckii]|uniref:DUF6880 family protein n=1 Tax=Oceanospirillum beijerinckii TaxID=64976 RepID=UPI0004139649|nr:DUF6880 family protein [Oceanospirillum beijerinckii]